MKAVVLASGGLDSTVAAAVARRDGYRLHLLSVDYGQRHRRELDAAGRVAQALAAEDHRIVALDLRAIGGSALTSELAVPKGRSETQRAGGIPATYVPARNTLLLALAVGYAETVGARTVFIGANVIDYSGYPDCRPEFLRAFEAVARLGSKAGVEGRGIEIKAPLIELSKAQIIELGTRLGVPFELTHSCYDPTESGEACGQCDSCLIRLEGFRAAGRTDPARYVRTLSPR
ncbi:MAG: 7-cyano-7-deazaguanine synthase QueC [Nitrospira sp.]|nr:MAG: 7-cyano-7-deazaguanine synthase QueC [Nitrospira sp.]